MQTKQDKIRINFVGDMYLSGQFKEKFDQNLPIFDEKVLKILENSNLNIGNLEAPIVPKSIESQKIKLRHDENIISILKKFHSLNLANNHILDYGNSAVDYTIQKLEESEIQHFGTKQNPISIHEINNFKIALIGFTDAFSKNNRHIYSKDFRTIKKLVEKAQKNTNFVILNYHGGFEFANFPHPTKVRFLEKLRKKLAINAIISHHSHTFQGIKLIDNQLIAYSVGNFVFDYPSQYRFLGTDESGILQLEISMKNKSIDYKVFPVKIERKKGIISIDDRSIETTLKIKSDFRNLKKKWRKEAKRIVFESKFISKQDNKQSLKNQLFISIFFQLKFYKKIIEILFDRNNRRLYSAALFEKYFSRK